MGDNGGRRSEYQLPSIKTLTGSPPRTAPGYPQDRHAQHYQYGQQQLSAPAAPGGHGQQYAHHQHQHQHHHQHQHQRPGQSQHQHPNTSSHLHAHPRQPQPQPQHQPQTHSQNQQLHTPTTTSRIPSAHSGYGHLPQSHEYRGYAYGSSYMSRPPLETPVSAPSPLDHYTQTQPHQSHKAHHQSGYVGYGSGHHHGQYSGEPMLISPTQGSPGVSGMARAQPSQPSHQQHYSHNYTHMRPAPIAAPKPQSQDQSPEYVPLSSHSSHSYYQQQQYSDAFARPPAPRVGPTTGTFSAQQKQRLVVAGANESFAPPSVSPLAGSADRGSKQTDATGSADDDEPSDGDTAGAPHDADEALLKRRKRNAQSAARLRERRKTREQELTTSCAGLESQIHRLQEELQEEKRRAKSEKTGKTVAVEEQQPQPQPRVESRRGESYHGAKRTLSVTTDGEGDSVMVEAAREGSKKRSRPLRELDQVRLDDLKSKIETLGKLNQQVCVNLGVLRQEIQRISQAIISQKDRRRD